ncbi:tetratricopeptide repeat protein [Leptolyngbyaceae cyanobacterium UHCC 1019]
MQSIQTLRLASVTLLLTAGLPLLPAPNSLLSAVAQTVGDSSTERLRDRKVEDVNKALQEVNRLFEQGEQQLLQGKSKAAIQTFEQILKLEKNNPVALDQIGEAYLSMGQYDRALETLQTALTQARSQTNDHQAAGTLTNLGDVHRAKGDYAKAIELTQQAIAIQTPLKDTVGLGKSYLIWGAALVGKGNSDQAIKPLQHGLDALKQATDNPKSRVWEGRILAWMGRAQSLTKQPDQGLQTMQQALAINRATGDRKMEATTLFFLGLNHVEQKKLEPAIGFYQQSLAVFQSTDDRSSAGYLHNYIGIAHYRLKQYPAALTQFQHALRIHQAGDRPKADIAQVWTNLGDTYKQQNQYPQAQEHYQQALTLYRQLKNSPQEIQVLSSIGYTHLFDSNTRRHQGDYTQAKTLSEQGLATFQQQLEVARSTRDRPQELWALRGIAQAYGNIGQAIHASGNYAGAVKPYEQSLQIWQQAQTFATDLKDAEASQKITQEIFQKRVAIVNAYNALEQYPEALVQTRQMRDLLQATGKPGNEQTLIFLEHTIYSGLVNLHDTPEQYDQFLDYSQKAIALAEQLQPPGKELQHWTGIARVHRFRGQYAQALARNQRVLARSRQVQDREQEIFALLSIGIIYKDQANYAEALAHYEQALQRSRGYPTKENIALINIANVYGIQGNYAKALAIYQDQLARNQKTVEQLSAGVTPQNIRWLCQERNNFRSGKDPQAKPGSFPKVCDTPDTLPTGAVFDHFKSMIATWRGSVLHAVAINFNNLGSVYDDQGNYPKAQELYQQSLAINQQQRDRADEANNLNNLGIVALHQGNYAKATQLIRQALKIGVEQDNRSDEIAYRTNLGQIASDQGNYAAALDTYQTVLAKAQKIGQRAAEAKILDKIAEVHRYKGDYAKALTHYQQALKIHQEIGQPTGMVLVLLHLGTLHRQLGDYPLAIATHQQALATAQKIGTKPQEAAALLALASNYREQGDLDGALKHYQQALAIAQAIGNRYTEASTLQGLGRLYLQQAQPAKASSIFQQALIAQQQMGVRADAAATLSFLGQAQTQLGKATQAQSALQESLFVAQEAGDRPTQAQSLSHLGDLFAKQKQPELAIAFYKQSVNVREEIKSGLKSLARSQQESYAQSVSGTYRALADLLLAQGRILEAQQVLELLKIQEIREFTREAKTTTSAGIATTVSEAKILKEHGTLIAFGQTVDACKQNRCAQLSQLNDQQQALTQQYNQTVSSFEKEIRRRKSVDDALLDPRNLSAKAKKIVESQPGTVLIYPFVLEDKIWLLWAAKGGIVKSVAVPVSRKQLGETVVQFRRAVQDQSPTARQAIVTTGKQLYDWLIKPLEPELKANKIQNLVFSLDRVTRYIPMSALFDGEKFLIENYAVSTILSAELTDLRDRLPANSQTSILALGASEFKDDPPLPNVPGELNAIIQQKSQPPSNAQSNNGFSGTKFLNQAFNFRALRDNLVGHKILHIATHGKFVSGRPEDSFLVLGSGEKLTIPEIKTLQDLSNIHLVVLSACETALGGDQDGIEISGLSSYFLSNGAKAVIASLWSVDDKSTSELMYEFYRTLATSTAQKPMTKAEALRQAQLSLIREGGSFAHPYHWAPFILIGNGL